MSNQFIRSLRSLKAGLTTGAIVALAALLPIAVTAQDAARLEGDTGIANVTGGDTEYKREINASNDQLVKVQMYYLNREAADSGRDAVNVRAKVTMPTGNSRAQAIKTSFKGDNTDALEREVTVNTDRDGLQLQYVPGSAVWKHNTGNGSERNIQETKLSDDIVTAGQGVVLENVKPGENFGATVSILARVVSPGVKVTLQSQKKGETNKWAAANVAAPGDTMRYIIGYQNTSNANHNAVLARTSLPTDVVLVPGSTNITNATNPTATKLESDAISAAGVNIGTYAAGANAYVMYDVTMPPADKLKCGDNEFRSVASVRPEGLQEYFASAATTVKRECGGTPAPAPTAPTQTPPPAPTPPAAPAPTPPPAPAAAYSCDSLTVTRLAGRGIEAKVAYTARNGAQFKSATYDFGDGSTPLRTDKTTVQYTYPKDGDYVVSVSLQMNVNGKDQVVTNNVCSKPVSVTAPATPAAPTATPGALPDTGTGETLAMVAAISAAGYVAHTLYLRRRLS